MDRGAVHAVEHELTQRRHRAQAKEAKHLTVGEDAKNSEHWDHDDDDARDVYDADGHDDHDDVGGPPTFEEGDSTASGGGTGCEDCVTFTIVAVVFLGMLGFFWFLYAQFGAQGDALSRRLQNAPKVEPRHLHLHVDLAQLYRGYETTIDVDRQLLCRQCAGTGMDLQAGFHTCHDCGGKGTRTFLQQIGPIKQHVRQACGTCKGRGQVPNKRCATCAGRGLRRESASLPVVVEPGAAHGDTLTLASAGDQAPRALPGDVLVHLHMRPHERFTRRGDDLELVLEISLLEALTGFTRHVEHLDARVLTLERRELVQPATVWRIPREGMPVRGQRRAFGDLVVRFEIQYPTAPLTEDQRAVVQELLADGP